MSKKDRDASQMLPKRRSLGCAGSILVFVILVFGAVALLQLGLWLYRPMFSNVYGRGGDRLFSMWVVESVHSDALQNAVIADYRLNLLVVFLTGGEIAPGRWHPYPVSDGVVFRARHEDNLDFHVPKVRNTMIIFRADGSRQEFPLAPGEAERIHKALEDFPEDLRPVLRRLYGQKHSAKLDLE